MRVWGCPSEVRIYNPQEKKLDPRTISGYFIGYAERFEGYRFYCPSHSTRIVESRNAKFLENDLISGSDQTRNIVSEKDHSESQPSPQVIDWLLFIAPLKCKLVLNNQSLKFHKLLTTFQ